MKASAFKNVTFEDMLNHFLDPEERKEFKRDLIKKKRKKQQEAAEKEAEE